MRAPPSRPPHRGAARRGDELARPIAAGLRLGDEHFDAITQSHERCAALGVSRIERPDHTPLARPDLQQVRERNLRLHEQAAPVMEMLHEQIVHSQSMVVLTDAAGTIIHSIGDDDFLERASRVALRQGAVWSESAKGTNAIGTALVEEAPILVHADEHYVHANHFLTCSAAPILDPRGNMLGVLDVSGDHRSYHQHTMALVKMSARMIENRWLSDDYRNLMRLHLHSRVEFIGTLMEGILAVSADGRIVGANRGALEQLGLSGAALRLHTLTSLFGTSVNTLVDRFRSPLATPAPLHLASGRAFHVLARFNWPVWTSLAEAMSVAAPAAPPRVEAPAVRAALTQLQTGDGALGAVIDKVRRVVDSEIPIIIVGERGTGKEVLARAAHADSRRGQAPFATVSCASSAPDLIEAELFGSAGKLAQAASGTLFLDEVGELPLALQGRLLQALESRPIATLCATRYNLRERVAAGRFREDLFDRLNGLTVRLPPLRERSDLPALARRILDRQPGGRELELGAEVQAVFDGYRWPGNVRQLFNVLRAASALAAGASAIAREHLPDDFVDDTRAAVTPPAETAGPIDETRTLDDVQTEAIRCAVALAGGNISAASKRLGVSRNTIYRKLRWNRQR